MKINSISLKEKISIFTILIILFVIIFSSSFFISWSIKNVKESIGDNNLNIAISVSKSAHIGELVKENDPDKILQDYTENIISNLENVDMLVIANMDGIRVTHPREDRLGQSFVGGDEKPILKGVSPYISEAKGTLGNSVRAFAPIYDQNKEQVGFIMVGTLLEEVLLQQKEVIKYILFISLGALLFGIIGSILLSYNIKDSLLGLEPDEISLMYTERNTIINSLHEGLIAIDNNRNISMVNKSTMEMFDIKDPDPIGKSLSQVFTDPKIEELFNNQSIVQKEVFLDGKEIVVNVLPMHYNNDITGSIATFRDRSETRRLAEEITGYNQIVNALRANNHEFKNKLHVILGLIHIEEYDKAKNYILEIQENDKYISNSIFKNIKNPTVVALIYGKLSRASELGVELKIDENSNLESSTLPVYNRSLVTILGNLIDNALEAIVYNNKEEKWVHLSIKDQEEKLYILVKDNGLGIDPQYIDQVFEKGFTSKEDGMGIGLSLVKEKVDFFQGHININSQVNTGTSIEIELPKEVKND